MVWSREGPTGSCGATRSAGQLSPADRLRRRLRLLRGDQRGGHPLPPAGRADQRDDPGQPPGDRPGAGAGPRPPDAGGGAPPEPDRGRARGPCLRRGLAGRPPRLLPALPAPVLARRAWPGAPGRARAGVPGAARVRAGARPSPDARRRPPPRPRLSSRAAAGRAADARVRDPGDALAAADRLGRALPAPRLDAERRALVADRTAARLAPRERRADDRLPVQQPGLP